jgi:hypothetical protein
MQALTSSAAVADYPQSDGVSHVETLFGTRQSPANGDSRINNSSIRKIMKWILIGMVLLLTSIGCITTGRQDRSEFMNRILAQLDLIEPGCDCQVVELPSATQIPKLAEPEETTIDWPKDHHFRVVADRTNGQFWVERTVKGKMTMFGPGELRKK